MGIRVFGVRGSKGTSVSYTHLDSMRRVYDIVESTGKCKFLYMLDMPHEDNDCEKVKLAQGIHRLKKAYEKFSGKTLDVYKRQV